MTSMKQKTFGVRADDSEYLKELSHIQMPVQKGTKITTLNQQGFMRVDLDPLSLLWVENAINSELPFLELGAAYGHTTLKALEGGATVIANDISEEHLAIIRNQSAPNLRDKLYLNHASMPHEINMEDNILGGVLMCRVGHFFTAQEIHDSFKKIYNWLVPGGKLYFIATSPYHHMFLDSFADSFHEKLENGDDTAGYFHGLKEMLPEVAEYIPNFMHLFNEESITRFIKPHGFTISNCKLFDYEAQNSKGRGFVAMEATKPIS